MNEPLTPDSESSALDAEDFDIVFTVYTDQPVKAFNHQIDGCDCR